MKYERIKFLVIALKNSVEIYAWAPKPYHKFMAFKVWRHKRGHTLQTTWPFSWTLPLFWLMILLFPSLPLTVSSTSPLFAPPLFSPPSLASVFQSFTELQHRPQLVDLTVEEGQRLKVIYGSSVGFHVIDVDSGNPYDIYIPSHVSVVRCLYASDAS